MTPPLPLTAPAADAIAHARHYAGELSLAQLPRLRAAVADGRARIGVEWHGARGGSGESHLMGRIGGALPLHCAECDAVFDWPLELAPRLRLVYSEAEEQRCLKEEDPYLVQDDRLPLREITEDEILLALPLLPRCPRCAEICDNARPVQPAPAPAVESDSESIRAKPLAALKNLKIRARPARRS